MSRPYTLKAGDCFEKLLYTFYTLKKGFKISPKCKKHCQLCSLRVFLEYKKESGKTFNSRLQFHAEPYFNCFIVSSIKLIQQFSENPRSFYLVVVLQTAIAQNPNRPLILRFANLQF